MLLADIQFFPAYSRLVTTDEDNKRLKTEVSEMKARHRLEIERVTREKEQEMEEVHKRLVNCLRRIKLCWEGDLSSEKYFEGGGAGEERYLQSGCSEKIVINVRGHASRFGVQFW